MTVYECNVLVAQTLSCPAQVASHRNWPLTEFQGLHRAFEHCSVAPGVWVHAPAPISSVVPSTPRRPALAGTAQAARPDAGVCAVPATSRDAFTPPPLSWARSMNGAGVSGCALLTPR